MRLMAPPMAAAPCPGPHGMTQLGHPSSCCRDVPVTLMLLLGSDRTPAPLSTPKSCGVRRRQCHECRNRPPILLQHQYIMIFIRRRH